MKRSGKEIILRTAFVAYCLLMLWLLFGRQQYEVENGYFTQMGQNINLRPGATILLYINVLLSPSLSHLIPHAIINLGGNIGMFIPLGLFLPAIWPGLQKLWKTLLVTALIISLVEIAQLLSLVGSCDVDDLMLNVVGSGIGYLLYKLINRIRK